MATGGQPFGDGASATAGSNGDGNTAIERGADSFACAGRGDDEEKAVNEELCDGLFS